MSQGLVESGADVALVDLNRECHRYASRLIYIQYSLIDICIGEEAEKQAQGLLDRFKSKNPEAERYVVGETADDNGQYLTA